MLTDAEVENFIATGFVRIAGAFSESTAAEARKILWAATGCDPHDTETWTQPVIRLPGFADPPFARAARSPLLTEACDQLVGPGRRVPRQGLGTPSRFAFPARSHPATTAGISTRAFPVTTRRISCGGGSTCGRRDEGC
ncbi:hypothetical protein [Nocardia veterana]|uniref:hypothetical protein n=1 Tax=Nocardia veterana TaxID=132249 RepID=UPI0002EA4142|nr:hypothetical protein [Nocardia veterana]